MQGLDKNLSSNMSNLRISQGELITPEKTYLADLYIEDNMLFLAPKHAKQPYTNIIDAKNCYITPGLFDLQVNGDKDCNLWAEPTANDFAHLCLSMLKAGVTAFLPTLITDDIEHLHRNILLLESMGVGNVISKQVSELICQRIKGLNSENEPGTKDLIVLPGIHLEGPYLSNQRPGVHPPQYIRPIVMTELSQLIRPSIKLMTLAPEAENGKLAIQYLLKQGVLPSLGHSNATFAEAVEAFAAGVSMVTHIFNALSPIHQRQPGAVVAALLNQNVYCCVICDGLHVDPQMVNLLVKIKGKDKVILVTDIANTGTAGGGLVGSSIKLSQAVTNIVKWGIVSFAEAIQMATLNPAKAMNLDNKIGQIQEGRRADLVIWDKQSLMVKHVIANGIKIF